MAAYNFTNSPSDGDTVTANGITYTYSSSKTRWDAAAESGSSITVYATIDDLPLSGPSTGDQAFVTGNNRLYIWNGTGWYNIALINTTPSISGVSSSYTLATNGTATTVTITATDPEGIPITYSIASDTSGNIATVSQGTGANTNVFTITPTTNTANTGTFSLTFRASDGVNIATAVSQFTLQFSTQDSNYTTALITSVGANNAVNNSFADSSTNSHTITANGNVTQNTFSPYRHGGYSTYLDGNGDTLTVPSTSTVAFGTGAFTVEAWVYILSTGDRGIFQTGGSHFPTTASASSAIQITNSGTKWGIYANNTSYQSTVTYSLNRWYHVALVRGTNSYTTLYVDGTSVIGISDAANYSGTYLGIGSIYGGAAAQCFNGYIRDFRVVKGTAVYTSNFTPPTERLTAITNTSLLTCHLPYIADGSSNDHSITVNGNTKTEPFSPYDYETYSAADNGGSMYFDGSGDYLSSTITGPGTGDFTYEFWYYPTNSSFSGTSFNTRSSETSGADGFDLNLTSTSIQATYTNSIWLNVSTSAIEAFSWNHIALVRNSGTVTIYVNGTSVGTASQTSNFSSTSFNLFANVLNSTGLSGNVTDFRYATTAVYTSNFTPPTAPLTAITNTSLLLNGTDAGIIDKSQSVKTITLNGDVKSSTTQSKYLSSSMYFDGAGDYLTLVGSGDLIGNASKFTIEGWYFPDASSSGFDAIYADAAGYATAGRLYNNGGTLTFYWTSTGSVTGSSGWTSGQWNHFAVTYDGTTLKVFIDGSEVASTTSASFSGTSDLTISNSTYPAHGYISDFRVTKGLARYTSNFTPPTAALEG